MWQCVVLCFVFLVCGGQFSKRSQKVQENFITILQSSLVYIIICRANSDCYDENALKIVDLHQLSPSGDPSSRIVGGVAASIESYNYTVQLLRNNHLACGGSLLTFRTVLTSAHCFFESNGFKISDREFSVRAGSSYLDTGGTVVQVRSVILHPQYNTPVRDNDIAVVVLRRALTRSRSIDRAGIPRQWQIVPDGQTVVHVGWGFTDPLRPVASNVLRQVQVYTINREICRFNYARLQMQVTTNMICAGVLGVGGRDACQGDSGGPLLWRGAVVGVTSWGYGCGHPDYPGVSAYVPHYTDWIIRTVEANGTSPSIASIILLIASVLSALLVK